ncbi:PREDICTED: DCN1-like protein 2 [Nicotiana attenuata]|uniref:Defective in cullin neddylation protein n=1 Tax=Nicotiana attenuata TaxID=49451 RepID=A0A1J6JGM0_NICAT|nr:PREDICTED: DCN1-like protein 2 [Nicotiana attenuata]OIT08815.1 hypothetical protein A4A49_45177 [Nicotiana attenuata]
MHCLEKFHTLLWITGSYEVDNIEKSVFIHGRAAIFEEVYKLMLRLNLEADFSEFSRFYDFVFFICRENGQKNITISKAVTAWKLVLAGRFRLLDHWCNFVEVSVSAANGSHIMCSVALFICLYALNY